MNNPVVSVVTITYNHGKYIARAIESVLRQKLSCEFEYIISDDNSTDDTYVICKYYADRYPNIIKLIKSTENVGGIANEKRSFLVAKGKYIATCEGEDYWTDEYKLQKQLDFMEANADYSACFHRYSKYYLRNNSFKSDGMDNLFDNKDIKGITLTDSIYLSQWTTQYLTMMFRKSCFNVEDIDKYHYYRDTVMTYLLYITGKIFVFSFNGGVYNITGNGIYTSLSLYKRYDTEITVLKEMWNVNRDYLTKTMYLNMAQDAVFDMSNRDCNSMWLLKQSFDIFRVNHNIKRLLKNIKRVLLR